MVPETAVVVWQVRGLVEDVHCFFFPRRGGFALAVERAGERLLDESFNDLTALIARARQMKDTLVEAGFQPIEQAVDPRSLEWLLRHFVRSGGTPVLTPRPC